MVQKWSKVVILRAQKWSFLAILVIPGLPGASQHRQNTDSWRLKLAIPSKSDKSDDNSSKSDKGDKTAKVRIMTVRTVRLPVGLMTRQASRGVPCSTLPWCTLPTLPILYHPVLPCHTLPCLHMSRSVHSGGVHGQVVLGAILAVCPPWDRVLLTE